MVIKTAEEGLFFAHIECIEITMNFFLNPEIDFLDHIAGFKSENIDQCDLVAFLVCPTGFTDSYQEEIISSCQKNKRVRHPKRALFYSYKEYYSVFIPFLLSIIFS